MDINLIAALIGGAQGQLGRVIKNHYEFKRHKAELKYNATAEIRQITNDRFINMQAATYFMVIFYVCVAPFIVAFSSIPIEFAYMESNGWLSSIFTGSSNVKWYTVDGLPIGPVHIYLASSVIFYLAGNLSR